MKTLKEYIFESESSVAKFLKESDKVAWVSYPDLEDEFNVEYNNSFPFIPSQ